MSFRWKAPLKSSSAQAALRLPFPSSIPSPPSPFRRALSQVHLSPGYAPRPKRDTPLRGGPKQNKASLAVFSLLQPSRPSPFIFSQAVQPPQLTTKLGRRSRNSASQTATTLRLDDKSLSIELSATVDFEMPSTPPSLIPGLGLGSRAADDGDAHSSPDDFATEVSPHFTLFEDPISFSLSVFTLVCQSCPAGP